MNHSPMLTHMLTQQKFHPHELVPYGGQLWWVRDVEPTADTERAYKYTLERFADRETWRTCSEKELVREILALNY